MGTQHHFQTLLLLSICLGNVSIIITRATARHMTQTCQDATAQHTIPASTLLRFRNQSLGPQMAI